MGRHFLTPGVNNHASMCQMKRRRFSRSINFKLRSSVSFEAIVNLLGFCSLNLSTYCSLSLLHKENIVDVVVVVVALAGEEVTL